MEFFLTLTFLFAVGALCGWVIELRNLSAAAPLYRIVFPPSEQQKVD